jgi:hypothetical protein
MLRALIMKHGWKPDSSKPPGAMKKCILITAMTIAATTLVSLVRAEPVFSVDIFYEPLDAHGSWFEMGDYGYVWQPHGIDGKWTPYSDGRWVYTDAGWTWYSNEPFGWAVYHYGRWLNVREIGWVWVPGARWGPGWVSWRLSPRYVGWAPLPPEAHFTDEIGISTWADRYYDIGPGHYRFIELINLGSPRLNLVCVDCRRNVRIINESTNITNIVPRGSIVFNGGPHYDEVVGTSREPIPRYRLKRRSGLSPDGEFRHELEGTTLVVADLPLGKPRERRPEKVARDIGDFEVDRGWRDLGSEDEIAATRQRMQEGAELPRELPGRSVDPAFGDSRGTGTEVSDRDGDRPATRAGDTNPPAVESGLPPLPRPREPGSGMLPGTGVRSLQRSVDQPETRPESKGTMKDPAAPGTEIRPDSGVSPPPGPAGDRPGEEKGSPADPPVVSRPESKGTMKDPAGSGTGTVPELRDGANGVWPKGPDRRRFDSPGDREGDKVKR